MNISFLGNTQVGKSTFIQALQTLPHTKGHAYYNNGWKKGGSSASDKGDPEATTTVIKYTGKLHGANEECEPVCFIDLPGGDFHSGYVEKNEDKVKDFRPHILDCDYLYFFTDTTDLKKNGLAAFQAVAEDYEEEHGKKPDVCLILTKRDELKKPQLPDTTEAAVKNFFLRHAKDELDTLEGFTNSIHYAAITTKPNGPDGKTQLTETDFLSLFTHLFRKAKERPVPAEAPAPTPGTAPGTSVAEAPPSSGSGKWIGVIMGLAILGTALYFAVPYITGEIDGQPVQIGGNDWNTGGNKVKDKDKDPDKLPPPVTEVKDAWETDLANFQDRCAKATADNYLALKQEKERKVRIHANHEAEFDTAFSTATERVKQELSDGVEAARRALTVPYSQEQCDALYNALMKRHKLFPVYDTPKKSIYLLPYIDAITNCSPSNVWDLYRERARAVKEYIDAANNNQTGVATTLRDAVKTAEMLTRPTDYTVSIQTDYTSTPKDITFTIWGGTQKKLSFREEKNHFNGTFKQPLRWDVSCGSFDFEMELHNWTTNDFNKVTFRQTRETPAILNFIRLNSTATDLTDDVGVELKKVRLYANQEEITEEKLEEVSSYIIENAYWENEKTNILLDIDAAVNNHGSAS